MPDIKYGLNNLDRDRGNFPKLPVINMFVESADTEPSPALQSRPGLEYTGTVLGDGPVTALYQVDGVIEGQLFAISEGHLYSDSVDIGAIDGLGAPYLAGFNNLLFASAGNNLWKFDGATLAAVSVPDNFNVLSMCIGTDRLVIVDSGSGHFYWSNVLSGTIETLSFATAEQSPDNLLDCIFLGDTLILFGSDTVEFWPASSSNPDLPYTPLIGRTFQVGIRETGCATRFTNTFAWITDRNQICAGDTNTIISTTSLEEKLHLSTTAKLWSFLIEGVEFLACTLDNSTWVFSSRSSQWSVFESYGETNWIPTCYANGVFGSSIDGHLIQWSDDYTDFDGVMERRFRAGQAVTTGTVPLYNMTLRTNQGHTPYSSGTYSNPSIEMRTSKDGGNTWGLWKERSLGEEGHYRNIVRWSSLGFFGYPALLAEFRVTDPVPFRISGVTINDPYGGI